MPHRCRLSRPALKDDRRCCCSCRSSFSDSSEGRRKVALWRTRSAQHSQLLVLLTKLPIRGTGHMLTDILSNGRVRRERDLPTSPPGRTTTASPSSPQPQLPATTTATGSPSSTTLANVRKCSSRGSPALSPASMFQAVHWKVQHDTRGKPNTSPTPHPARGDLLPQRAVGLMLGLLFPSEPSLQLEARQFDARLHLHGFAHPRLLGGASRSPFCSRTLFELRRRLANETVS